MMGHALWKGTVHFDGNFLPVKLHSAVKEERIGFHLLHRTDGVRLHQQLVCGLEKMPVPPEEVVRGVEIGGKGRYVILGSEELEELTPQASRLIEVQKFVGVGEISPLFFERGYNLEPDGLTAGYAELLEVLLEKGLAGICRWTMRKRSYLGAICAGGKTLRLCGLRYADEVAPAAALGLAEIPVTEREIRIGCELIGQLTTTFEPGKYQNEHETKLRELLAKRTRGEKVALLYPKLLKPTDPDKLLDTLEASLNRVA